MAPLKAISVTRLEIQACLMAARLTEFIKKQMDFDGLSFGPIALLLNRG